MSQAGRFCWSWRVGWATLAVLLAAALPSARADLITGTTSTGDQVSVFINFFTEPNGIKAPLTLSNQGGTVSLDLPNSATGEYGILFAMKVNGVSLDFQKLLSDPTLTLNPPDPTTGHFSFTPTIDGKTYTITGDLQTAKPIKPDSWNAFVIPGIPGFSSAALFTFATNGDPMLTFSITDANGQIIHFTDSDGAKAPEPASLALAGLGVVGLAGYGLRRRRKAA